MMNDSLFNAIVDMLESSKEGTYMVDTFTDPITEIELEWEFDDSKGEYSVTLKHYLIETPASVETELQYAIFGGNSVHDIADDIVKYVMHDNNVYDENIKGVFDE